MQVPAPQVVHVAEVIFTLCQHAITIAQSEAQGALSQDQVPRAYKGAVKDYFNDLK